MAFNGDTLVDLIYCPKGLPVDDELIGRGEELSVLGMDIRVMAMLQIGRALREQIDWPTVQIPQGSTSTQGG